MKEFRKVERSVSKLTGMWQKEVYSICNPERAVIEVV